MNAKCGYSVVRQWGCDGEFHHDVSKWHQNALRKHSGAILVFLYGCVLPLCQIALNAFLIIRLYTPYCDNVACSKNRLTVQ